MLVGWSVGWLVGWPVIISSKRAESYNSILLLDHVYYIYNDDNLTLNWQTERLDEKYSLELAVFVDRDLYRYRLYIVYVVAK